MPRRYPHPEPHTPLTSASTHSHVEIEHLADDAYTYRLNGGPLRTVTPAPYGIYNVLRQLEALIYIIPATPQATRELRRMEREFHEDIIDYETRLQDCECARLFGP